MAMLASKPSFPAAMGSSPAFRNNINPVYGSPTESEFSDSSRMSDTVKYAKVNTHLPTLADLCLSVETGTNNALANGSSVSTAANMSTSSRVPCCSCLLILSDLTNARAANNITGENLMDMDPATLKEMGVNKIGDRVRIGSQAKLFRTSVYKKTSKRNMNRVSLQPSTITYLASC